NRRRLSHSRQHAERPHPGADRSRRRRSADSEGRIGRTGRADPGQSRAGRLGEAGSAPKAGWHVFPPGGFEPQAGGGHGRRAVAGETRKLERGTGRGGGPLGGSSEAVRNVAKGRQPRGGNEPQSSGRSRASVNRLLTRAAPRRQAARKQ